MPQIAYTPPQVAEQLQVKPITVLRWLRAGKLTGSHTPAGWRVQPAEIAQFLAGYRNRSGKPLPDWMPAQEVALRTVWDNPEDEVWNDA